MSDVVEPKAYLPDVDGRCLNFGRHDRSGCRPPAVGALARGLAGRLDLRRPGERLGSRYGAGVGSDQLELLP